MNEQLFGPGQRNRNLAWHTPTHTHSFTHAHTYYAEIIQYPLLLVAVIKHTRDLLPEKGEWAGQGVRERLKLRETKHLFDI